MYTETHDPLNSSTKEAEIRRIDFLIDFLEIKIYFSKNDYDRINYTEIIECLYEYKYCIEDRPACSSTDEEWKKKVLETYNTDKREYLSQMGIDYEQRGDGKIEISNIDVKIYRSDSLEIMAMKIRNAEEGKEFIECEFVNVNEVKKISGKL